MKKFIFECCEKYYETIKNELYRPDGFVFRDDKGRIIDTRVIYIEKADMKKEKIKQEITNYVVSKYLKGEVDQTKDIPLVLDSLDRMEIAMWAEKEYDIEISQEEIFGWNYLSDITACVTNKVE